MTKRITKGTSQVVISGNSAEGPFWANLYVNVTPTDAGDITGVRRNFKTMKGAEKWAAAELAR